MEFKHLPVLLKETIEGLDIKEDGVYLDCTVGGGGHAKEIAKRIPYGKLYALDQDLEALASAKENLKEFSQVHFIHGNFLHLDEILQKEQIEGLDGILLDIGVSSYQLDEGKRGFSFHEDAPLDMRMDQSANIPTAADIVNSYSLEDLIRIFYDYGEEAWSKRIANFIVESRNTKKLESTFDLVEVIKKAIPKKLRQDKHPATKVFQALRIEVNQELIALEKALDIAIDALNRGGRLCVISFHSLEDRIVKETFRKESKNCICPKEFPICVCNHKKKIKEIVRRPVMASKEEVAMNRRSRSAKLRIAERV